MAAAECVLPTSHKIMKKVQGSALRRTEECWWLPSCSALGVVLRRLLCEHSSSIAYPAATVQTGDSQGNQTMPWLQKQEKHTHMLSCKVSPGHSFVWNPPKKRTLKHEEAKANAGLWKRNKLRYLAFHPLVSKMWLMRKNVCVQFKCWTNLKQTMLIISIEAR